MDRSGGYQEFDFVAEFYDAAYADMNRKDIDFYVGLARKTGGPVLEIACGTGRVLLPTARAGIDIFGIDLAENMLMLCRERVSELPEEVAARIRLQNADMCDFEFSQKFDLITIPFRPFMHLTTIEDQFRCLECVRRHLTDDGLFAFDIFFPDMKILIDMSDGAEWGEEPEKTLPDGRKFLRRFRFEKVDPISQVSICDIIFHVTYPDGKKERLVHRFPIRYTWRFEAEHLLKAAGFEIVDLYGDFESHQFSEEHHSEQIFVCRKK